MIHIPEYYPSYPTYDLDYYLSTDQPLSCYPTEDEFLPYPTIEEDQPECEEPVASYLSTYNPGNFFIWPPDPY